VKFPEGWELVEPTLQELESKIREGLMDLPQLNVCVVYLIEKYPNGLIFLLGSSIGGT